MIPQTVGVVVVFHNGPVDGRTLLVSAVGMAIILEDHPDGRYVLAGGLYEEDRALRGDWWWIPCDQPT